MKMKAIFLALFVVAVTATPVPEDSGSDAVEMIVNGVLDGAALEVGDIVDIKLKEHANGAVVATDLLHPYTAVGIAEAAAVAAAATNDVSVVDSDLADVARNIHPMPVVIPSVPVPDAPAVVIPEPILMPPPAVPEPIMMPPPAAPEVVDEPEQLPVAAPQFNGEVYNDGLVQVQYNGPEEPGMLATLQNWFNIAINYFNSPESRHPAPHHHY